MKLHSAKPQSTKSKSPINQRSGFMNKYDSYKDSGIEWIGEIPSHWEVSRFKYAYKFVNEKSEFDLPKIGLEHIESWTGRLIENDTEFDGEGPCFRKNDILFGKLRPYLAKVYLAGFIGKAVGDFFVFRPEPHIQPKYGHRFLLFRNFIEITNSSTFGSKMPRVSPDFISNLDVIIPTFTEQAIIATYLDRKTAEIDELIADKKRLLELYEEEKTALINQAVTKGLNPDAPMKDSGIEWLGEIPEHWEVKRLKYYFNLITEKIETDLPKIGLENIESKSGKFIPSNTQFAGRGILFKPKDILFGKLRPYLAKVWLADFDGEAVGDFYVFRTKHTVVPKFAKFRILDSSFIDVANSSTYGSKMPRVSWEFIGDLPIALPSAIEQQSIVRYIETETTRIDDKKANTEKLIDLLTEYRTALISEVVTGKVKVV